MRQASLDTTMCQLAPRSRSPDSAADLLGPAALQTPEAAGHRALELHAHGQRPLTHGHRCPSTILLSPTVCPMTLMSSVSMSRSLVSQPVLTLFIAVSTAPMRTSLEVAILMPIWSNTACMLLHRSLRAVRIMLSRTC